MARGAQQSDGNGGNLIIVEERRCHGGTHGVYRHAAGSTDCEMTFSVFRPAGIAKPPVLFDLSGLTCTPMVIP